MRVRIDRLDGMVLGYLREQLFNPARLQILLKGHLEAAQNAQAAFKEKVRQAPRCPRRVGSQDGSPPGSGGDRSHVASADLALKERLVALSLQMAELDQDIVRFQESQQTGNPTLSAEKLPAFYAVTRKKLVEGPPELRQAYMRLILDRVAVSHQDVVLEGLPKVLEKLAQNGPSNTGAEVLSLAQEWRPREDSNLRPPV